MNWENDRESRWVVDRMRVFQAPYAKHGRPTPELACLVIRHITDSFGHSKAMII